MSPLDLFINSAGATELVVVASPSTGFGPVGVFVFFALLAAGFVVLKRKSPETAAAIERAVAAGWRKLLGLFRK